MFILYSTVRSLNTARGGSAGGSARGPVGGKKRREVERSSCRGRYGWSPFFHGHGSRSFQILSTKPW